MMRTLPLLLLAACVSDPALSEVESKLDPGAGIPVKGCPKWGCNENSPVMGLYNFHEIHLGGLVNKEGIRIDGFWRNGVRYRPFMAGNGSELRAEHPVSHVVISGHDLEGGRFRIFTDEGDEYYLIIAHVTTATEGGAQFWVGPQTSLETYELTYSKRPIGTEVLTNNPVFPLCHNPPARTDGGEGVSHLWERRFEAVLFTHERIDAAAKEISARGASRETDGWMTIGCAGSALAKLHLNRHTVAGATINYVATQAQEQALLKMYVSDVCGTGHAFTEQGTPLHWENRATPAWNKLTGNEYAIEALWDQHGAKCLNVHRLGSKYDNPDEIGTVCDLPACSTLALSGQITRDAYLLSAVPENPF